MIFRGVWDGVARLSNFPTKITFHLKIGLLNGYKLKNRTLTFGLSNLLPTKTARSTKLETSVKLTHKLKS